MTQLNEELESFTWTDLWAECTQRLGSSDEARRIIEQASGRQGASWLITMTNQAPIGAAERVGEMIRRRLNGEPLQYVLGRWGFRQLNLHVDRRVLIPRPETEQVVEAALNAIAEIDCPVIVDMGTGSGAIALSLAMEIVQADVYATDISTDALQVAERNLSDLPASVGERVHFAVGSWFDALPTELKGNVDLLITNPPYVAEAERDDMDYEVLNWEPNNALFAGIDGLDDIRSIIPTAYEWLNDNGRLVIEIAPRQAIEVERMAWETGFFSVEIGTDFTDRKRWLIASK